MNNRRVAGSLTIVGGTVPLLLAGVFVFGFGAPFTSFVTLVYLVPAVSAIVGGFLLCIGRGPGYGVSIAGWCLLVIVAAGGLLTWLTMSEGSVFPIPIVVVEGVYVVVGLVSVVALVWARKRNMHTKDEHAA